MSASPSMSSVYCTARIPYNFRMWTCTSTFYVRLCYDELVYVTAQIPYNIRIWTCTPMFFFRLQRYNKLSVLYCVDIIQYQIINVYTYVLCPTLLGWARCTVLRGYHTISEFERVHLRFMSASATMSSVYSTAPGILILGQIQTGVKDTGDSSEVI